MLNRKKISARVPLYAGAWRSTLAQSLWQFTLFNDVTSTRKRAYLVKPLHTPRVPHTSAHSAVSYRLTHRKCNKMHASQLQSRLSGVRAPIVHRCRPSPVGPSSSANLPAQLRSRKLCDRRARLMVTKVILMRTHSRPSCRFARLSPRQGIFSHNSRCAI